MFQVMLRSSWVAGLMTEGTWNLIPVCLLLSIADAVWGGPNDAARKIHRNYLLITSLA